MEEKRKKERRETWVRVAGFGALAVCYLAMACWNCWDQRAELGIFSAIMASVCAGGMILEREARNAAEYCEDIELALDLLERRGGVGPDECVIYLEEAVGVLVSPEEHIRLWAKSDGGTACVWKGEARRLPPELRKLPLLRFSGRAPEETEVVGYLEIETELPEGWKMKDAAGPPASGKGKPGGCRRSSGSCRCCAFRAGPPRRRRLSGIWRSRRSCRRDGR